MIRVGQWLRTVRFMSGRQVAWRLRHGMRRLLDRCFGIRLKGGELSPARLVPTLPGWSADDFPRGNRFVLLNREKHFTPSVNWNFLDYGPLWRYRLNAFDWIVGANGDTSRALDYMQDFLLKVRKNPVSMEPWPLSRRIVNWIRILDRPRIDRERRKRLAMAVFTQAQRLARNPEYHLPGNHLLENGLALLRAGSWLRDQKLLARAERILEKQLAVQILEDGGHVERSTMYHCLLLAGLFDALDLAGRNPDCGVSPALRECMVAAAAAMLGWVEAMTFTDGSLACLNDSSPGEAPPPAWLRDRADRIGIRCAPKSPGDSGYRWLRAPGIEALFDAGPLGPDANPGHGHCDTLSVLVHAEGKPLLVDPGVSSYDDPEVRRRERGTAAHNTVMADGMEQNEIWGVFRVGRRARVRDLEWDDRHVYAAHSGYDHIGLLHRRRLEIFPRGLVIRDEVSGRSGRPCRAHFHFAPGIHPEIGTNGASWPGGSMSWRGGRGSPQPGWIAAGFNRRVATTALRIEFVSGENLVTRIRVET